MRVCVVVYGRQTVLSLAQSVPPPPPPRPQKKEKKWAVAGKQRKRKAMIWI